MMTTLSSAASRIACVCAGPKSSAAAASAAPEFRLFNTACTRSSRTLSRIDPPIAVRRSRSRVTIGDRECRARTTLLGRVRRRSRELARKVADDGYEPDLVLSIARGGLLVGAALGYALDVKNTWTMNVEFYTGVDERLDVPMILPPVPELVDLESSRMLIADDVADTGETLRLVKEFCAGKVAEVRCAVLYEKSPSVVKCEYVWRRTDLWIDFPWSAQAPVTQERLAPVGP